MLSAPFVLRIICNKEWNILGIKSAVLLNRYKDNRMTMMMKANNKEMVLSMCQDFSKYFTNVFSINSHKNPVRFNR